MILRENNMGETWVFDAEECRDYAYVASCMPTDRMPRREVDFVRRMEARFRGQPGGLLTPGQWAWFAELANRHADFIQGRETAPAAIREFAARCAREAGR